MDTVQEIIRQMKQEVDGALAKKGKIDKRLAPEHQQTQAQQIDAELRQELAYWREQGDELIARQRKAAEVELQKAHQKQRPSGAGEWTEAAARSGFVEVDVEAMEPAEISKAYELAKDSGDRIGAWLLARAGLARLDALATAPQNTNDLQGIRAAGEYGRLAEGLREKVYGQAQRKYRERVHGIDRLAYELHEPCHEWEEADQVRAAAERYNIKQPAPETAGQPQGV